MVHRPGARHCLICGKADTEPHPFRHQFTTDEDGIVSGVASKRAKEREKTKVVAMPDAALRQLLLDKGLITSEELGAANDKTRKLMGGGQ